MTETDIEKFLRGAPQDFASRASSEAENALKELKRAAVAAGDQPRAKRLWCLQQALEIQDNFIKAFQVFKAQRFYDGWCLLERIEIALANLERHFTEAANEYQLALIAKLVPLYQSLFPYKVFMSPEILGLEKTCNICDRPISIRNPCEHRVGEIYNGEMCIRIVTKAEMLGTAMVRTPVQKYSVPFLVDPKSGQSRDHYNYSLIKSLTDRLQSPFHDWSLRWTKVRHPHSRFSHVGRNEPCPCESGKKYKKCCLREPGVLRPHCQFSLSVPPPAGLPPFEYADAPLD